MRRWMLLLTLLVLILSACHRQDERLLGRWASVERAQGQIATVIEFRPQGALTSSWESLIDFKYQLGSGILLLSTNDTKTGAPEEQSFQAALTDKTLTLTNLTDNSEEHFKRSGAAPSGASPLAGEWQSDPPGDQPAYMDFRSDGTMTLRRVARSVNGSYNVEGDSLTITIQGSPAQKGTYRFDRSDLVLTPQGGKEIRYKRLS